VVIVSAYGTVDPGFESRRGRQVLRYLYIAGLLSYLDMHYFRKIFKCLKNIFYVLVPRQCLGNSLVEYLHKCCHAWPKRAKLIKIS
jgi:hypothetical protein